MTASRPESAVTDSSLLSSREAAACDRPPKYWPLESEHSRVHEAIEWWFVQGSWSGESTAKTRFMVTLFRPALQHVGSDENPSGFQLLIALLTADGHHHTTTWIDRPMLHEAIRILRTKSTQIDPIAQRAMVMELEDHGVPRPVLMQESPEVFVASPLNVQWDDFRLQQNGSTIRLQFPHPATAELICLELTADAPRMPIACEPELVPLGASMEYHTYPRMSLTGVRNRSESLLGRAWLDHQWGSTDWFYNPAADVILGWDWFGINMDDGSDWLVMLHRDARTGKPLARHATCRTADGVSRTSHDLSLTATRTWDSPETHTEYPVAWRIEIPELQATLHFEPDCDHQEVPSFGPNRSVWEGSGTIHGVAGGHPVTGIARGEFHGYGYVFDHEDYVTRLGQRVDARLAELLPREFDSATVQTLVGPPRWHHETNAYTQMLSVPVWDLIDRSGKRWRPLFGLLLLESLGVPSEPWERLICCMTEMLHAGALVIDDIEDGSLLRRGQECLHLRYGADVAINAGNTLYFLPGAELMRHPLLTTEQRLRLLMIKEQMCIDAHCGQATDIYWSRSITKETLQHRLAEDVESKILQMYAFKTAAAPRGIASYATTIAGAGAEVDLACADFGQALGVCYQVIDDIHNFSRSPKWTKTVGEDLSTGKLTFVIATAIRRLETRRRARLEEILVSSELRTAPEVLAEGIELVRDSGALEVCRDFARSMTEDAWSCFSKYLPPSQPKIMLHTLVLKLVDLAFDG